MAKISGYLTINRKIDEWEYLDQPLAYALWMHLLRLAAWKDTEDLKRGEVITSIRELTKITGIYRAGISHWLSVFEESGQITIKRVGKQMKIILLNYEKYNPRVARKLTSTGSKTDQSEKSVARKLTSTGSKTDQSEKSVARKLTSTGSNCDQSCEGSSLLNINNETIKSMNKGITHIGECDPPDVEILDREDVWFREFWKEYPRHKAKAAAKKSFQKLCTGEKVFNEIMDGLKRSQERWERLGTEPRYIPYPSTWLNQQRWEDEDDIETSTNVQLDYLEKLFATEENR